jgi:hypothetical protein
MQFPTLHCHCEKGHIWATLIPEYWFEVKDIQCPECYGVVVKMKAGNWKTLEEIQQAYGNRGCTNPPDGEQQK